MFVKVRRRVSKEAPIIGHLTKGRAEELKALAVAKKAIASMTGGASGRQYGFLQLDNSPIGAKKTQKLQKH